MSRGTRRGLAVRRQLALVMPADLQYLQSSGTVTEALRPFFGAGEIEGTQLTLAYEGEAGTLSHRALSAPRKALLEEYMRAGLIMRGELARYAQTQDPDAGSRAITAMGRRTAILEKLGLENAEVEVPDLASYLAQKASEKSTGGSPVALSDTNGDHPDSGAAGGEQDASARQGGGAPERECSSPSPAAVSTTTTTDQEEDPC